MPGRPHMPRLHHRIHDHVMKAGKFTDSAAWAIAVDAVAKGCKSGDTNFPGKQTMGAVSRARYCAAYAEWKKNHSGSGRGTNPSGRG